MATGSPVAAAARVALKARGCRLGTAAPAPRPWPVRRFTAAKEGRRPNWEDIVEVLDGDGDRLFRDLEDAHDQALWLVTEQWVDVKAAGLKPGARAKSVWRHSQARRAHKSDIDAAAQIAEAADAAR